MEAIKQFQQTIEYIENLNKPQFKLSQTPRKIGEMFENFFKEILRDEGFIEDKDFQDLRNVGLRQSMENGLPDFYFPKSKTFIEIKSSNNGSPIYNQDQKEKIRNLIKEGYKVKTIFFNIQIRDSEEDSTKLMEFIGKLKCN